MLAVLAAAALLTAAASLIAQQNTGAPVVSEAPSAPSFHFYVTDSADKFRRMAPIFLGRDVENVEHVDLGHGWFRFTMTVTHPLAGEVFFQTGRFCAAE